MISVFQPVHVDTENIPRQAVKRGGPRGLRVSSASKPSQSTKNAKSGQKGPRRALGDITNRNGSGAGQGGLKKNKQADGSGHPVKPAPKQRRALQAVVTVVAAVLEDPADAVDDVEACFNVGVAAAASWDGAVDLSAAKRALAPGHWYRKVDERLALEPLDGLDLDGLDCGLGAPDFGGAAEPCETLDFDMDLLCADDDDDIWS